MPGASRGHAAILLSRRHVTLPENPGIGRRCLTLRVLDPGRLRISPLHFLPWRSDCDSTEILVVGGRQNRFVKDLKARLSFFTPRAQRSDTDLFQRTTPKPKARSPQVSSVAPPKSTAPPHLGIPHHPLPKKGRSQSLDFSLVSVWFDVQICFLEDE